MQYSQQDCLTPHIIGPARAYENTDLCGECVTEGEVISPPSGAASVSADKLTLKKILVVSKEMNAFRPGYWDIELKFVFVYTLIFRDASGDVMCSIKATNIFNKKVTLFGSYGSDIVIGTDLFCNLDETQGADPFVMVEGKAISLDAELKYCKCHSECGGFEPYDQAQGAVEVLVTIGLFTIIKLFRIVNLSVESRGFCIAEECEEISPLNPCEFFDNLDFPVDIFSPPQKEDFGCKKGHGEHGNCGCDEGHHKLGEHSEKEEYDAHGRRRR
jgi:hypothetical protein